MLKQTIALALSVILISVSFARGTEDNDEITFVPPGFKPPVENIVKVIALPTGRIILDGKPEPVERLRQILASARGKIVVWYHRDPGRPPTEAQRRVISLILENKAPVSLSSKPDFSDYVDKHGQTHPRRP